MKLPKWILAPFGAALAFLLLIFQLRRKTREVEVLKVESKEAEWKATDEKRDVELKNLDEKISDADRDFDSAMSAYDPSYKRKS